MGFMWSREDFGPPEMWRTYDDLLPLVEDHFVNDTALSVLADGMGERGQHGVVGGLGLVVCALHDLMGVMSLGPSMHQPTTGVDLLGRVPGWAGEDGQLVQNLLANWAGGHHPEALDWIDRTVGEEQAATLARGLAERLHFAVGATAILTGSPVPETATDFCRRFDAAVAGR
jgi:hypothetical protein